MSPTIDMKKVAVTQLEVIEESLMQWDNQLQDWAKRIPWAGPQERNDAMVTARFIRKLVAEAWIHVLAAKSRGGDEMDASAFNARRVYRQIQSYGAGLAERMEARLPEAVPNLAA